MRRTDVWVINRPGVISEVVDGETIAINLQNGIYYSFNKAGSYVWQLIECGRTLDSIAVAVAEAAVQPTAGVRAEVLQFTGQLVAEGLISGADDSVSKTSPQSPVVDAVVDASLVDYEPPQFQKFEDLNTLLLADPIHDVGEMGWPNVKTPQPE